MTCGGQAASGLVSIVRLAGAAALCMRPRMLHRRGGEARSCLLQMLMGLASAWVANALAAVEEAVKSGL